MIRILTRRAIRADSWERWIFHPDPELLASGPDRRCATSDETAEVDAFTRTVSSIRVGKFHKLTRRRRLSETIRVLARYFSDTERDEIHILDVGGSDGTTTHDAVRDLGAALRKPVRATLMDRYVRLERRRDGWLREYCMPDGSPVMLRLGPFGLQLSSVDSTRDPISRKLGSVYLERRKSQGIPELERTYSLIHPVVMADERVGIVEWNALERNPDFVGRFDAIRASNILNENYFSRREIECILSHIHTYLVPGGCLVVSRNHLEREVESEHGSLWRQTKAGFARIEDFGSGSYVAQIVGEFKTAETC